MLKAMFVLLIGVYGSFAHATSHVQRIISLSPHTTEWIYELQAEHLLVAVSDHSDYPADAQNLPSVANYQGVNFEKIIELQPDLILAWTGGNQPQDIDRLKRLGFSVFESNPTSLYDIPNEITAVANLIQKQKIAHKISEQFSNRLATMTKRYDAVNKVKVFYYLWATPLMTVGDRAWATHLLRFCGAENIFSNSVIDYPEVSIESVIARQPKLIISATGNPLDAEHIRWTPWFDSLNMNKSAVRAVNPDRVHRFTSRILDGLDELCLTVEEK